MTRPKHRSVPKPQPLPPEVPISGKKKIVFYGILILIPFLVLFLAEGLLRVFQYQASLDSLVLTKIFGGKDYYSVNPEVSKRYFASHNVGIPQPYEELFEVHKSAKTLRIFCLGESTMYGYPYPSNATAPRFLRDRLEAMFPERTIEVVNLGIPAVSSAVVLDLLKEALDYQPDLIVIYSGHNEFYGTYGVASTEYLAQNKQFLDFYMQLRRLKVFQLARNIVLSTKALLASQEPTTRRSTFLERMVEDKYIPFDSPKYVMARRLFEANVREMVSVTKRAGVPIYFSTLVSNWKDLPPFISSSSSGIPDSVNRSREALYQQGLRLQQIGKMEEAAGLFERSLALDTARADTYFHLAQCLLRLHKPAEARTDFLKAKDLDVLRFRASSEFNEVIRRVGTLPGAGLVDLEKVFAENSPDGILGDELITEHLHPNERGYFLMGKAFARSIRDADVFRRQGWSEAVPEPADDTLLSRAGVTDLDIASANIRVQILKSAWPFTEREVGNSQFHPADTVQQIAFSYCEKSLGWDEAHYRVASYYAKQGDFEKAAHEYYAVARELYLFYHPLMLLGDMQVLMRQPDKALATYRKALNLSDNQFIRMRLGTLSLVNGENEQAIDHLRLSLQLDDEASKKFTEDVRIIVLRELATAFQRHGNIDSAIVTTHRLLDISPGNQTALEFLRTLEGR